MEGLTFNNRITLLERLITRGDMICVDQGRVRIRTNSGRPVPEKWLGEHHKQLLKEIAQLLGLDAYLYTGFSTGKFNNGRCPGVALQFEHLVDGSTGYAVYNVSLARTRNTKYGNAGETLPAKQFRVGVRSEFMKLWLRAGLPVPKRLASISSYMGNLRGIMFRGERVHGERLDKQSLAPISIPSEEIARAPGLMHALDKPGTIYAQVTDKIRTCSTDREIRIPYINHEVIDPPSAGQSNCGKMVIRYKVPRETSNNDFVPLSHARRSDPQNQSVEEWLADYDHKKSPDGDSLNGGWRQEAKIDKKC